MAKEKVTVALALSADFAKRDSLTVPTHVTTEGAARQRKESTQSIIDNALSDDHAGVAMRDSMNMLSSWVSI